MLRMLIHNAPTALKILGKAGFNIAMKHKIISGGICVVSSAGIKFFADKIINTVKFVGQVVSPIALAYGNAQLSDKIININPESAAKLKAVGIDHADLLDATLTASELFKDIPILNKIAKVEIDAGQLTNAIQNDNYKVADVLLRHGAGPESASKGISAVKATVDKLNGNDDSILDNFALKILSKIIPETLVNQNSDDGQTLGHKILDTGKVELINKAHNVNKNAFSKTGAKGNTIDHKLAASPELKKELGDNFNPQADNAGTANSAGLSPMDIAVNKVYQNKDYVIENKPTYDNHAKSYVDAAIEGGNQNSINDKFSVNKLAQISHSEHNNNIDGDIVKLVNAGIINPNNKDPNDYYPAEYLQKQQSAEVVNKMDELNIKNNEKILHRFILKGNGDAVNAIVNKLGEDSQKILIKLLTKTNNNGQNIIMQALHQDNQNKQEIINVVDKLYHKFKTIEGDPLLCKDKYDRVSLIEAMNDGLDLSEQTQKFKGMEILNAISGDENGLNLAPFINNPDNINMLTQKDQLIVKGMILGYQNNKYSIDNNGRIKEISAAALKQIEYENQIAEQQIENEIITDKKQLLMYNEEINQEGMQIIQKKKPMNIQEAYKVKNQQVKKELTQELEVENKIKAQRINEEQEKIDKGMPEEIQKKNIAPLPPKAQFNNKFVGDIGKSIHSFMHIKNALKYMYKQTPLSQNENSKEEQSYLNKAWDALTSDYTLHAVGSGMQVYGYTKGGLNIPEAALKMVGMEASYLIPKYMQSAPNPSQSGDGIINFAYKHLGDIVIGGIAPVVATLAATALGVTAAPITAAGLLTAAAIGAGQTALEHWVAENKGSGSHLNQLASFAVGIGSAYKAYTSGITSTDAIGGLVNGFAANLAKVGNILTAFTTGHMLTSLTLNTLPVLEYSEYALTKGAEYGWYGVSEIGNYFYDNFTNNSALELNQTNDTSHHSDL